MADDFWKGKQAMHYHRVSTVVPSDIPAYNVVYHLLNPNCKAVLDFGCFQGISSRNLIQRGAEKVLGVDKVKLNIEAAKMKYWDRPNMEFAYVPESSPIPASHVFDAVCMTFVHPTIGSLDELKYQFKKMADVTRKGGLLVLLGIHPNSLNGNHNFIFYRHKLPDGQSYEDGAQFVNEIRLPPTELLRFHDYCWTSGTLAESISGSGFDVEADFGLEDTLDGEVGKVLRSSISLPEFQHLNWKDEWKAPLYQVIVGRKK